MRARPEGYSFSHKVLVIFKQLPNLKSNIRGGVVNGMLTVVVMEIDKLTLPSHKDLQLM